MGAKFEAEGRKVERRDGQKGERTAKKNEVRLGRDAELLTILRKREAEMEGNMLKKIEAFKYLYREQFKEFGRLMK